MSDFMKNIIYLFLIVGGLLYYVWKNYTPGIDTSDMNPAQALYHCYEEEEKKVSGWSESELMDNFYVLQSQDWCYEAFAKRMSDLEKKVEEINKKGNLEDPDAKKLITYLEEGHEQVDMVREYWYSHGWRERWSRVLEADKK